MRASVRGVFAPFMLALLWLVLTTSVARARQIETEAIAGEPFGVGKITVHLDPTSKLFPDNPLQLVDRQGRVLYPAFERTSLRVPTTKDAGGPGSLTAYFLFRGDEPLKLELQTSSSRSRATARPIRNQGAHRRLLEAWWSRYTAAARSVAISDVYQPLVENYLTATLGRRLNLKVPQRSAAWSPWAGMDEFFALITGAESVRLAAQSKVLLEHTQATEVADRPLPKPATAPPVRLPYVLKEEVAIEPIAFHVPVECFYIRCGSFANFLWLRDAIDDWGTQMRHLASVRGLDYRISPRIERQLALRQTAMAKLLGGTVISDVVILGSDTFLREGAAVGVLFEARSSRVLKQQISQQRQEALKREKDAKEETVRIAGHDVSLLSTPNNQVRSFYAIDGKYHLVTTSRTIVQRFFEAGRGQRSLGRAKEFRWARSLQPVSKNHTVFVYLSDPLFHVLVSPHYRIEMTRRVSAASEIDVVRLAQLAARAEGYSAATVKQLVDRKLLPEGFGRRPDGSHVVVEGGQVTDSLRGAYGSFLPVPDVEIAGATPSEVKAYTEFARRYESQWERMDPVIVGIKRRTLDGGAKQRVTFDVHITPYARRHYELLTRELSQADKQQWVRVPGDIASIQANLAFTGNKPCVGVRDWKPPYVIKDGAVHHAHMPGKEIPVYLAGRKGKERTSGFFPAPRDKEPPDEEGDVRVNFFTNEGWLRRLPGWDLFAQSKEMLNQVAPHVKLVPAERPAQGRLRIADLQKTKMAAMINAEGYIRARKVSAGNVFLMRALMQQFHVPVKEAKTVAEKLLNAKLLCPLGGEYELNGGTSGLKYWNSTAWNQASLYQETRVPEGYRAELLDWFAGVLIELNIDRTTLSTHIELDVRTKKN